MCRNTGYRAFGVHRELSFLCLLVIAGFQGCFLDGPADRRAPAWRPCLTPTRPHPETGMPLYASVMPFRGCVRLLVLQLLQHSAAGAPVQLSLIRDAKTNIHPNSAGLKCPVSTTGTAVNDERLEALA